MFRIWKAMCVLAAVTDLSQSADSEGTPRDDMLSPSQLLRIHDKIDKNSDGKASLSEIMHFSREIRKAIAINDSKAMIAAKDSNGDGKLSFEELQNTTLEPEEEEVSDEHEEAHAEHMIREAEIVKELDAEKFKASDVNGDGLLDEQEIPAFFYPEIADHVLEVAAKATLKDKDKDGDGLLTSEEFWEGDDQETSEESNDFVKLDKDGSGKLDVQELKHFEAGHFHTEEAMKRLLDVADTNRDMHISADELAKARDQLAESEAHYHFMEWVEHDEL